MLLPPPPTIRGGASYICSDCEPGVGLSSSTLILLKVSFGFYSGRGREGGRVSRVSHVRALPRAADERSGRKRDLRGKSFLASSAFFQQADGEGKKSLAYLDGDV